MGLYLSLAYSISCIVTHLLRIVKLASCHEVCDDANLALLGILLLVVRSECTVSTGCDHSLQNTPSDLNKALLVLMDHS